MEIQFEDLDKSDFFIDCVYKGGKAPNMSSEPFHKLILGCENAGGFRKKLREDGSGKYAYMYYIHQWRNWNGRTTWTKRQGYFGIMEIIENLVEN